MTNENDLAYPFTTGDWDNAEMKFHFGLTKREYFAAMAMQGILAGVYADSTVEYVSEGYAADKAILMAGKLINALNQNS